MTRRRVLLLTPLTVLIAAVGGRTVTGRGPADLRRLIGEAVRARVAGPDADAAHARIRDTPGPRWFSPADLIWQVHSDASLPDRAREELDLPCRRGAALAGALETREVRWGPAALDQG